MKINFSEISDDELAEYNRRGWIPGPDESEKAYLDRIERLNHLYSHPPKQVDQFLTDGDWSGSHDKTRELFDFAPDWVVAYFSNKNLSFFQGAATWLIEKESVRIPLIQLKEKFMKGSLWKLYRLEEVLAHEAVHAARMQFDEPLYEEIFAYRTSPHIWRRFLGPIFQRTWETILFICLLFLPILGEVMQFAYPQQEIFKWFWIVPAGYFIFLVGRLKVLWLLLILTKMRLKPYLRFKEKAWAVLMRLKDVEIIKFAFMSKKKLEDYLIEKKDLRWRVIASEYLKK